MKSLCINPGDDAITFQKTSLSSTFITILSLLGPGQLVIALVHDNISYGLGRTICYTGMFISYLTLGFASPENSNMLYITALRVSCSMAMTVNGMNLCELFPKRKGLLIRY